MDSEDERRQRPLDRLCIRDLQLRCIVGINPDEREKKQDVVISVTLHAELSAATATDSIDQTVDYKKIKEEIVAMVEASSFNLIERLAEEVARICLRDPRVEKVDVTLDKPGALRFARTVGVEIVRSRRDLQ